MHAQTVHGRADVRIRQRSGAPYRIYNIGNHSPVPLIDFISTLEEVIGKKANLEMRDLQPGDVPDTFADIRDLERDMDFKPKTSLLEGLSKFYEWYQDFHSNRLTLERQTLRHFQQMPILASKPTHLIPARHRYCSSYYLGCVLSWGFFVSRQFNTLSLILAAFALNAAFQLRACEFCEWHSQ